MTEVIENMISVRFDCDTTTTRLRQTTDMFIFCLRQIGSRCTRYVVVGSQSYRSRIALLYSRHYLHLILHAIASDAQWSEMLYL